MKKHIFFVFVFLLGLVPGTSLQAAVEEEYKSIEQIDAEQKVAEEAPLKQGNSGSGTTIQNQIHNTNHITLNARELELKSAEKSEKTSEKIVVAEPVASKVEDAPTLLAAPAVAYSAANGDVVIESETSVDTSASHNLKLTPLMGATLWSGRWRDGVRNQFSLGLALELPVTRYFAFEAEGMIASQRINYQGLLVPYDFNQYIVGGNSKVYLMTTKLRPYIGAGLAAVFFDRMTRMAPNGMRVPFNPVIGSANLMAGLEMDVSDTVSIGGRASWLVPVINNHISGTSNGFTAAPGFEETSLLTYGVYRIMGTVSVKL